MGAINWESLGPSASRVKYRKVSVVRNYMLSSWYVTVHSTVITKTICTTVAHGPMWPVQRSIQLESKNCSCWRRKWQSTPVFLPGESHGQRSLAGCSAWGRKEADMTDRLTLSLSFFNTIVYPHTRIQHFFILQDWNNNFPFPLPAVLDNHHSIFRFCEFGSCGYFI